MSDVDANAAGTGGEGTGTGTGDGFGTGDGSGTGAGFGAGVGSDVEAAAYPSLDALQQAHAELLKARRQEAGDGWSSAFANQVAAFLERGRLTGIRLGPFADRQVAQSTLDFWRAALARQGWSSVESALVDFDPSQRHLTFGDAMVRLRRQQRWIAVLSVAVLATGAALALALWQASVAQEQKAKAEAEARAAREAQATSVVVSGALDDALEQRAATLEALLTAPPELTGGGEATSAPPGTDEPSGSGGPDVTPDVIPLPPPPLTPGGRATVTPSSGRATGTPADGAPPENTPERPWLQYDPVVIQKEIDGIRATQEALGNVAAASWLDRRIAIDGDLADWPDTPIVESAHVVFTDGSWDKSLDVSARWRLGWDDESFYVGVAVDDEAHVQLQSDERLFLGDSVEVQLDTGRVDGRPAKLDADTYQCILSPGDFEAIAPAAQCFRWNAAGVMEAVAPESALLAARWAAGKLGDGYVIEASMRWSDIGVKAQAGRTFGATFSVTDTDTPGARAQEVFLSNVAARRWSDPTTWGILRLAAGRYKY